MPLGHRAACSEGTWIPANLHNKLPAFFDSFLRAGFSERRAFGSACGLRGSLVEVGKKFALHLELHTWIRVVLVDCRLSQSTKYNLTSEWTSVVVVGEFRIASDRNSGDWFPNTHRLSGCSAVSNDCGVDKFIVRSAQCKRFSIRLSFRGGLRSN